MTNSSPDGGGARSRPERLDSLFLLLADEYRRHILRYFVTRDTTTATVAELIEYAHERSRDERSEERLASQFHHVTLPKLAEHYVIEFDRRSETVRYHGPPAVAEILRTVEDLDVRSRGDHR